MTEGRRRLFIYYRVAGAALDAVDAAVRQAQRRLCDRHAGLQARLLQRPDAAANGERTLMETYATDASIEPEGVEPRLQAQIEAEVSAALAAWVAGANRHVEVFVDLDDACAS